MISLTVLVCVAVMSVGGGWLALREPRIWRRFASLAAAVASIASAGSFLRLLQAYNSQPLGLVAATHNPLAGLGPWDGLALLLSLTAIIAAAFGANRARILLMAPGVLMFCLTLLVLTVWD
jgi:hypothetical protein